jgi:hypothetical protein
MRLSMKSKKRSRNLLLNPQRNWEKGSKQEEEKLLIIILEQSEKL